MLKQIPTHLIGGPLGAGKTSLLQSLLRQRPANEHWALLINEFGQLGLDMALLGASAVDGVTLSEIPGGCLCCVNGLPFQVGLGRLLRKAKPSRVFIEASGLGHPAALLKQLAEPPWRGVLALQPLMMVLDAASLQAGQALAETQQQALPLAGLLLCNKAEGLDVNTRHHLQQQLPVTAKVVFTSQGELEWQAVPQNLAQAATLELPNAADAPALPDLWPNPAHWRCAHQLQRAPYSLGWRMSPKQQFSLAMLQSWLQDARWQRAKGIVNTDQGWKAFNLLPEAAMAWTDSPWRQDNRIELIISDSTQLSALEQGLRAATLSQ
ncbi:CobW family GTP-binding protein [Halopseudomonas sp.]|uniref:CobW family GTP-binding protein n=1 Tax=Halopseudomonas sp. TaxID=2901191 RepID=UPI0030010AA0